MLPCAALAVAACRRCTGSAEALEAYQAASNELHYAEPEPTSNGKKR